MGLRPPGNRPGERPLTASSPSQSCSIVSSRLNQPETLRDTRDAPGQGSGQNAHLPPDTKTARKLSLRAVDLR
jgi:hypothetical protein